MTPRAATPLETDAEKLGAIIEEYFGGGNGIIVCEPKEFSCELAEAILASGYTRAPSSPLVGELREALGMAKGYMLNAKIDLETGAKKATALATLEGGLKLLESALARAKERG